MASTVKFNEDMVLRIDASGKQKQDALTILAEHLIDAGYVKDSYKDGILKREGIYPTGLFTGGVNVAVPHTDCVHVNQDAIAVGLLSEPIVFKAMDNPERDVDISIIVMLALKEPHGQIDMLQKVIALVKQQKELEKILNLKDTHQAYEIIASYLA